MSHASITCYFQGIKVFTTCALDFYQQEFSPLEITSYDPLSYREYVSKVLRRKPATLNYNIQVLKIFYAWALSAQLNSNDPALALHFVKRITNTQSRMSCGISHVNGYESIDTTPIYMNASKVERSGINIDANQD